MWRGFYFLKFRENKTLAKISKFTVQCLLQAKIPLYLGLSLVYSQFIYAGYI